MKNTAQYLSIINYLNNNIWVRLAPTTSGVGVKAIRDIPINTQITDYDRAIQKMDPIILTMMQEDVDQILENVDPEIANLLRDRYFFNINGSCTILSPNCIQFYRFYINHSDNPNVSQALVALRHINKTEEITFNYKENVFENASARTKDYYKNILNNI